MRFHLPGRQIRDAPGAWRRAKSPRMSSRNTGANRSIELTGGVATPLLLGMGQALHPIGGGAFVGGVFAFGLCRGALVRCVGGDRVLGRVDAVEFAALHLSYRLPPLSGRIGGSARGSVGLASGGLGGIAPALIGIADRLGDGVTFGGARILAFLHDLLARLLQRFVGLSPHGIGVGVEPGGAAACCAAMRCASTTPSWDSCRSPSACPITASSAPTDRP